MRASVLVALLLIVGVIARDLSLHNLFSKSAIPSHVYWSFGSGWHVGPWILGTLLGAFTIVGFESAANLAEETYTPERVAPEPCGKRCWLPRCSGSCSSSR